MVDNKCSLQYENVISSIIDAVRFFILRFCCRMKKMCGTLRYLFRDKRELYIERIGYLYWPRKVSIAELGHTFSGGDAIWGLGMFSGELKVVIELTIDFT